MSRNEITKFLNDWKAMLGIVGVLLAGLAFAADQRYEKKGAADDAVKADRILTYELKNCLVFPDNCENWEHSMYKIYVNELKKSGHSTQPNG